MGGWVGENAIHQSEEVPTRGGERDRWNGWDLEGVGGWVGGWE